MDPPPSPANGTWDWGVPPEALDNMAGYAVLQGVSPAKVGSYWYGGLRATQPGWIQVRFKANGMLVACHFYALYVVHLLPDDAPAPFRGLDIRYGTRSGTEFPEMGGPYGVPHVIHGLPSEPPAEEIEGADDRFETPPQPEAWTGAPLAYPRTPRWLPEIMLRPLTELSNSYAANRRNDQLLRIFVRGPRESVTGAIPINVHCTNTGTGDIKPGGVPLQTYDVLCQFTPPEPSPGADATWGWPLNVPPTPSTGDPPPPPLKRDKVIDDSAFLALYSGMAWILRVPWMGKATSSTYGDIELEVQVPNPSWVWTQYGDPQGLHEGVMHADKRATVVELQSITTHVKRPNGAEHLLAHWWRRIEYALVNSPAVGSPDMITLGMGVKIDPGLREDSVASVAILRASAEAPTPRFTHRYFPEAMANAVNQKLETDTGFLSLPNSHWSQFKKPADTAEPWSSDPPASLRAFIRGYVGAVRDTPNTGALDFDSEPAEPDAYRTTWMTVQHFVNVVADANNDGFVDVDDDDDSLESGLGKGLLVCENADSATAQLSTEDDRNLRRLAVRFSSPLDVPGGNYSGFCVWLKCDNPEASGLHFWRESSRQNKIPLVPSDPGDPESSKVWPLQVPEDGSPLEVWVGASDMASPTVTLWVLLCAMPSRIATSLSPPLVPPSESMTAIAADKLLISSTAFGLAVDSNNDGLVNDADDAIESTSAHFICAGGQHVTPLRLTRVPELHEFEGATVTLRSTVPGRVSATGPVVLPKAPTSTGTFVLDPQDISGSGFITAELRGWQALNAFGEVDLQLELAAGEAIVGFDWVRVVVFGVTIAHPTGDPTLSPAPATSEFVFGSGDPGELEIRVAIATDPDSAELRAMLGESFQLSIDAIGDSHADPDGGCVEMAWEHGWPGSDTLGKGVYDSSSHQWEDTVTFIGLPESNGDFGPKSIAVAVMVNGASAFVVDTTIEVFWPLLINLGSGRTDSNFAKNHPGSDMNAMNATDLAGQETRNGTRAPNWLYYWSQVVEANDGISGASLRYMDTLAGNLFGAAPAIYYFASGYSGPHGRLLIGALAQGDDADPDYAGPRDRTFGIDAFRDTVVHEHHHALVQSVGFTNSQFGVSITGATAVASGHWSFNIVKPNVLPASPLGPGRVYNHYRDMNSDGDFADAGEDLDSDGDGVPDASDAGGNATVEGGAFDAEPDDDNFLAREDWGSPGKNHGTVDRYDD